MHYSALLKQAEQAVGVVCLLMMFVIICVNVIMRYVFSEPLYWAEELSNYLFVWIGFLSCANSVADGSHIRVTAFANCLNKRIKRWVALAMDCLLLATFGAYILPSWSALAFLHISSGLQIPEKYPYAILPISMALCFVHVLILLTRDLQAVTSPSQGEA